MLPLRSRIRFLATDVVTADANLVVGLAGKEKVQTVRRIVYG